MKQENFTLSPRLFAIANLVSQDAVLADVGTDHAYLPIFLLQSGRIRSAVCTDIHKGPIACAKENIDQAGLSSKIQVLLTDGLQGVAPFSVTDIVIAGMGGELIAQILATQSFVKDSSLHLLLQPMSKPEKLRAYLWNNGFQIQHTHFVCDKERIYQIFEVRYTAVNTPFTPAQLWMGFAPTPEQEALYLRHLEPLSVRISQRIEGLIHGQQTPESVCKRLELQTVLSEIENWRNTH